MVRYNTGIRKLDTLKL